MMSSILREFEESEKKFDDLLASLSDISCENTMAEVDAKAAAARNKSGVGRSGVSNGPLVNQQGYKVRKSKSTEMNRMHVASPSFTRSLSTHGPKPQNAFQTAPSSMKPLGRVSGGPLAKITYEYKTEPVRRSRERIYQKSSDSQSSSNNISETESYKQRYIITAEARSAGSYSPSSYESLTRDKPVSRDPQSYLLAANPYKDDSTWPRHSSPFTKPDAQLQNDLSTFVPITSSQELETSSSNNASASTSPHLTNKNDVKPRHQPPGKVYINSFHYHK